MCRKHALWALAALTLAAALAACSGGSSSSSSGSTDSSSSTSSSGGGTPILVQSFSGTARAYDGTWISCIQDNTNGVDERDTWVVTGAAFTFTADEYPFNSVCAGTKTHVVTVSGTGSVTGTKPGVTWTDGSSTTGQAPTKGAGTGPLPDPVTASVVDLVITTSDNPAQPTGTVHKMLYIDDSGPAWTSYSEKVGPPACDDSSAVGKCLSNQDHVVKQ